MAWLRWKWRLDDGEAAARAVVSPPVEPVEAVPLATEALVAPGDVVYRSEKIGLRIATRFHEPIQFHDGVYTTADPEVILTLDGLAVRRPDLLSKEA